MFQISQQKLEQRIKLNQKEEEIFRCFQDFVNDQKLNTKLRVAGGWVRDKLLGKESHDIDIALDNMMGADFVKQMNNYLEQKNNEKSHGFGVTKFNPDKSKHLETACVRIKDTWIDVVNLRGETYSQNSRIPQMSIGTPVQDAERRDLTINSLFYNISEDQIEDFTGKGLIDLQNGIIRTPLDPLSTFLDDPLRILRTIRFTARFNYEIVPEIYEALKNQEIRESFKNKVSRERVGIEMNLMINSNSCFKSLELIYQNNLWDLIFELPKSNTLSKYSFDIINNIHNHISQLQQFQVLSKKIDQKTYHYYVYLAGICYPYHNDKYQQGKAAVPMSNYILLESLKLPKKEFNQIALLIEQTKQFQKTIQNKNYVDVFETIVKWIQDSGSLWELSLFLQFCVDQIQNLNLDFKTYNSFITYIYEKKLECFYDTKPLINGNEICSLIGAKPGPEIKNLLVNIVLWQARYPQGSKQDLISEIKENPQLFTQGK